MKRCKPNVIFIYADDLGIGIPSCYGQTLFSTPNIDALANNGVRFTRAYATAFCAPARACLLTGIHDAHAGRWTKNSGGLHKKVADGQLTDEQASEAIMNTGMLRSGGETYLPQVFAAAGYVTGQIGKLEWGFNTCAEELELHGWDYHYGYYDHVACHGFYPPFVHENGIRIPIEGNTDPNFGVATYDHVAEKERVYDMSARAVHSQDLYDAKIYDFIRTNRDKPFFLYHPSQLPHGPVFFPDIHPSVRDRDDLITIEKEYVSMVLRLDQTVGMVVDALEEFGLTDKTMIVFASDNGHANQYEWPGRTQTDEDRNGKPTNQWDNPFRTETCGDTFNGNMGLAGLKFSNWDGGVRVPHIVSMPGTTPAGVECDDMISHYDFFATACELVGKPVPRNKDALSYLGLLEGREQSNTHDYVVFGSPFGPGMVTRDGWKLRSHAKRLGERARWQLYNVKDDPAETIDLAEQHPDKLIELKKILLRECDGNELHGQTGSHDAYYTDIELPSWQEITQGII
jgi:arylsulfatase A-like enzyme